MRIAPFTIAAIFLTATTCFAQPALDFSSEDRILVIAPHPDDEIIAVSGIIQRGIKNKAQVKIAYLTCGDYNEISFMFYKKRPAVFKNGFISIGKLRQKEALSSARYLGVEPRDLIFMGYPDRFTETILTGFWDIKKPCKSLLTNLKSVPYENALSFGAPYVGQNIMDDFKKIINDYKPTKIFVSSPQDTNPDHRSAYVYLYAALLDARQVRENCAVYSYLVHKNFWPRPKAYLPREELAIPDDLKSSKTLWVKFILAEDEIYKKFKALLFYKSQLSFDKRYLLSFIRRNELLSIHPETDLNKEKPSFFLEKNSKLVSSVFYRKNGGYLQIKIIFHKKIAAAVKCDAYLLGYKKNKDFKLMPKIFLKAKKTRIVAYCLRKAIKLPEAKLEAQNNTIFLEIPLKYLDYPEYIFSRIILKGKIFAFYVAPWRVFKI